MRKTLAVIALLSVVLLLFPSAYNAQEISTKVGAYAPNFSISGHDTTFALSNTRGHYVLINFWTSADAESRIRTNQYDHAISTANKNGDLQFASINFDRSEKLLDKIIKNDALRKQSQFFDKDGINSEVYKMFHLNEGFNSFLLDKEGKIIAVNPDMQKLTDLMCQ